MNRTDSNSQGPGTGPLSTNVVVEPLFHEYGGLIFHLIQGMVGQWQESQDLTQEVFISWDQP